MKSRRRIILTLAILLGLLAGMVHAQTLVMLPAGVYAFDSGRFKSNTTYLGAGAGKTIIRNTSSAAFSYTAQLKSLSNVKIIGVSFDGNGVELQSTTSIQFEDSEFINAQRSRDNHQAIFGSGNKALSFLRCRWSNDSQAVQLYAGDGTTFDQCRFEKSGYGFKHGMGGGRNLRITSCVWDQMRATMGAEIQNDQAEIDGVYVADCAYVNPELYADDSKNGNAMAFSLPMAKATNILVERCFTDGYAWILDSDGKRTGERRASRAASGSTPRWAGLRDGFEVGGTKPIYRQNWARNLNDPGAVTTSVGANCSGNRIDNCLEAWDMASPANGISAAIVGANVQLINGRYTFTGNGDVALPAKGGWSLVGVMPPRILGGAVPDPAPAPTPDPVPIPQPPPDPAIAELTGQLEALKKLQSETAAAATAERAMLQGQVDQLKAFLRDLGAKATAAGN